MRPTRHARTNITRSARNAGRSAPARGGRHQQNPSGVHFLARRSIIAGMVRSAGVGPGDLTVELGAGPGILTVPLAATGSRVLAVERDADFVARLTRRFADRPTVRIVHADLRSVLLPRRPFAVVANLPFSVTTAALRRLLGPVDTPLTGADLLIEWNQARRLTAARPRTMEAAWWAARFQLRITRRVPANSFSPAPRVDAAQLTIRPRRLDRQTLSTVRALLADAYQRPDASVEAVLGTVLPRRRAHRLARSTGISPPTRAGQIAAADWARLANHPEATRRSSPPGAGHPTQ